ncbi:small s protein [Neofusicoccum parvum]|nr:small s protein [Neofusicoccum parvum]
MTEIANTTITVFNAALDCFERIQIARSFGKDFAALQIKLDIIQLRLSRWGEAAGICKSPNGDETALAIANPEDAVNILQEINDIFGEAREESERMRPQSGTAGEAQLSNAAHGIQWAIYKKELFLEFIAKILELVEDLEKLFPTEDREKKLQELSNGECEGIGKTYLSKLADIAQECDPYLKVAVEEALKSKNEGGNVSFSTKNNYGLQQGYMSGTMNGLSFSKNMTNKYNNHYGQAN